MSSALKPVLTPSGVQNPPASPQLSKPTLSQATPTTYGQPVSHIPQNLVNISHNAQSSTNVHIPAHSAVHHNATVHTTSHSSNHYSLNVPNAMQHYSLGGSSASHSTTVSSHLVANTVQTHTQPTTFSTPPKNLSYSPNYQSNLAHSYKLPNIVSTTQNIISQSQIVTAIDEPVAEKSQSNGTPEVKISPKVEPPQNHVLSPAVKDKLPPTPPPLLPQTPPSLENSKTIPEQCTSDIITTIDEEQNEEVNKPSEIIDTSLLPEKESSPILVSEEVTNVSNSNDTNFSSITTSPVNITNLTAVSPVQIIQPVVSTSASEIQESSEDANNLSINPKPKEQSNQKSTLKLATTLRTPARRTKVQKTEVSDLTKNKNELKLSNQKSPSSSGKSKRTRIRTQPYQSPLPEVEMISKISATTPRNRNNEDKLIIFYKNEFLAVRNSEGSFYVCQAVQNIYKSSPRIRIRWLSQDKNEKEIYTPDFYDYTDFDCILTNLNLTRTGKGRYKLPAAESIRTDSILKRALAVEKGDATPPSLTEEHPDGLDLSLYKEESQLKKRKSVKRKATTPLKIAPTTARAVKISPDQPKARKIVTKTKSFPIKKTTVIKKALSTKIKKSTSGRTERAIKRQQGVSKGSTKTSPVIDQKKAKVLAKVARKVAVVPPPKVQPPPKIQQPPKQNNKTAKPSASLKKPLIIKKPVIPVTRKSKRGKK